MARLTLPSVTLCAAASVNVAATIAALIRSLDKVQFADWVPVFESASAIPNVARFLEQARALQQLLLTAAPDAEQQKDLDFMLVVGHLFIRAGRLLPKDLAGVLQP